MGPVPRVNPMTGFSLLGLVLLSMAWLFFIGGAALNFHAWRMALRARRGSAPPVAGILFLPGVVGSLASFFTVGWALKAGYTVHWPWLWITLPLVLDVYCAGGLLLALLGLVRRFGKGRSRT